MTLFFIICFLCLQVRGTNISNLNDFTRNNIIYGVSKFSNLYYLKKAHSAYDEHDKKMQFQESHAVDNTLYFYSTVDQESSLALEQKLLALNHHNLNLVEKYQLEKTPIHLHIQSFGGSLFHTLYLVDLIKNLETPVYTYIDGFAASAATLISISGKRRFMSKNSLMLIHQLSSGSAGKYSELKDESENLDVLMDFIITHYLEQTKLSRVELMSLLKRDLWLNSSSCLHYGLVDEIL